MAKNKEVKLPKGVTQEFVDSLVSMSGDQLKALIVNLQLQNEENEAFKQSESFISEKEAFDYAKERFELVAGPVKDTTISIKNRTKTVIDRLKEKGIV